MNLKEFFYRSKQYIGINNNLHPTRTLVVTFLNPVGKENSYVRFYTAHIKFKIKPEVNYLYMMYTLAMDILYNK